MLSYAAVAPEEHPQTVCSRVATTKIVCQMFGYVLGDLILGDAVCRFLEARLEEADARRSSFEKQARQIVQSTKDLRRSTSSDLQRWTSVPPALFLVYILKFSVPGWRLICCCWE